MDYFIVIPIGFLIGIVPNYFLNTWFYTLLKLENNWVQKSISFVSDIIKGMLIILLSKYFLNFEFIPVMLSLITGVLAHGFLQGFILKARNGQFVALGGLSIFLPVVVFFWMIIWAISFIYKKNMDFSSISATILTGLVSITSSDILNNENWYSNPTADSDTEFGIFVGILFILLVFTQIDQFKIFFPKGKSKDN